MIHLRHKALAAATKGGQPCAPVLQLLRKQHGEDESETHLEIIAILAPNWRPQE